jgi:hypothetical protein
MDDIARAVSSAQARNEYLVRQRQQRFDWTALEPEVRAQIRRHAFDRWRQEVVVVLPDQRRWPVPYQAAEGAVDGSAYWLDFKKRFSFKRVPRSVADTEPLLTVTLSLLVDRENNFEGYEAPYNLSLSEQDSLCAQVEKTFCWTGVRQIRLIREAPQNSFYLRDIDRHKFAVELVSEETADDGVVIRAPAEFALEARDVRGLLRTLIQQLTEELGLVHTTVEVLHRAGRRGESFDDHVFRVPYARGREEVVYEVESSCRWPQSYRDTYRRTRSDSFSCVNQYRFKRVPPSGMDTAPLLTVTFSRRLYSSDFRQTFGASRLAPFNLSASQQDELRAELERPLCWQRVREIRLNRHIDTSLNRHQRITDHFNHWYTVQLVLEGCNGPLQVITVPGAIWALRIDDRAGLNRHPSLIRKLTEEMGLEHTTVPVVLRVAAEEGTYDNHVFRVK